MRFQATEIGDLWIVDPDLHRDERGFFTRSWCAREFEEHGLDPRLVQCNISFNRKRGTLRGMHFQASPHEEAKLVRVTRGAIQDVVIDLRSDSPTFKKWVAVELNDENRRGLFIPAGMAHGFQTLVDDSEVFYQMGEFFHGEAARGIRWNDPAFALVWPIEEKILSDRDRSYPDFDRE